MWINEASYRLSSSLLPSLEARGEALILRRRIVVGPAKLGGQLAATFQASNQVACTMARPAQPLASCFSASSSRRPILSFAAIGILLASCLQSCSAASYGKPLGKLSQLHHGVSGEVFAVDGRTLYIKDLTYDGEGPAAYFYAGNSKTPIDNGFRVPDERGTYDLLRRYRKEDITLTLPEGKTLNNIRWFAIWCDDFSVNFGDVRIPRGFEYPRPKKLGTLNGIHGVSSEPVVIVDAQTLLIPGFSYDGEAPDAKFWAGPGPNPTPQGIRIPDENGKENPLRKYDHKTIVLTLPGDLTVHELGHFGVWCEAFTVDFGHVKIPQSLNVPPSLKMLGVSPQNMRGGQGQLGLAKEPSTPAAFPSILSSSSSQDQRVTTYRPTLRRNDQVQLLQSVDYRIPKSLHLQEPIQQVPHSLPITRREFLLGHGSQNDIQQSLSRLQQLANVQPAFNPYSQQFSQPPSHHQLEYSQPQHDNRFRNFGDQHRYQNQQQGSYARFLRYPGDQSVNSYVQY
ncbi:protein Skeletor, isoforms B/C isoform X2 [Neodiprion fabricii]|uniref:protein Skeletor, isoforms B/C isoform X2 n=1 Tax=Neodiprion fabricii TaxID=2872261 RepID=UPI001ED98488|nr:protein Skeletor, isoforms B/C isoform X2 [Neodiprion fabricii]